MTELNQHPANVAYRIEQEIDAKIEVSEMTEREKFLALVKVHNSKVKQWVKKENCQHEKTYPTMRGIFCRDCHEILEPRNSFEERQVSRLNYKGNGYVNYQFRP